MLKKNLLNQQRRQSKIQVKKKLEESELTTKAIEEKNESVVHTKTLELESKNGVIDTSLIRALAKFSVRRKKTNFDCLMILLVMFGVMIYGMQKKYNI